MKLISGVNLYYVDYYQKNKMEIIILIYIIKLLLKIFFMKYLFTIKLSYIII